MTQTIEAPTTDDTLKLATQILHGQNLIRKHLGVESALGETSDLDRIQAVLDRDVLTAVDIVDLQSLGILLGCVLVNQTPDLDWWMVDDSQGRHPAVRFGRTSLLDFPLPIISKRIEDGEPVDVRDLYETIREHVAEKRTDGEVD